MIGSQTKLTTSGQRFHHFRPSSSIDNYAETLQPVIAALITRHKIICECCGIIGHKSDACIIRGQKLFPPSFRRNINKFNNALHGDEPNKPPRECNSQPPAAHFKSRTSPSKTNPMISYIMGRLNQHTIYNGYVKVPTSYFPVESNSESVPYPDTTPIK